jgi:hypothetical protein
MSPPWNSAGGFRGSAGETESAHFLESPLDYPFAMLRKKAAMYPAVT